jgi:hypothetical protein
MPGLAAMLGKAFEEGVKAALKFFSKPATRETLAKSAEQVRRNLARAAKLKPK